ncbi:MAG TPA: hypothetical protein VJR48_18210 [Ktedonobacterales bacterium]|nr:hypothetical protein [Ktedonobacterales bacterium]
MQAPNEHADMPMPNSDDTSSVRRRVLLARGLWLAVVVFIVTVFLGSLPLYLAQLQTLCFGSSCQYNQLTPGQEETLGAIGLSVGDYAALTVALICTMFMLCLVVSALIVWRRPDDWMALLVALMLVALGPIIGASNLSSGPPLWQTLNQCLTFLLTVLLVLVFALFPSGRFVPRWMRWPIVVFLAAEVPLTFFPTTGLMPSTAVSQPSWLVTLIGLAGVALAQLYRYRRVSTPLQRQQTKWVVLGLAAPIAALVGGSILALLFPDLSSQGSLISLAANWSSLALICVPLSFGFAIFRYRLWDIDTIINKALVYGSLTVLLAGVYAALVVGLGSLAALTTGPVKNEPVVLVIATLATVALIQPVRRRLQALIDRRFYRRKYDAEKTLAAFSAALRNEVDLNDLRTDLLAMVQETMEPAHVSLWLIRRPLHAGE